MQEGLLGLESGLCLTFKNELLENTHKLTKQDILLGRGALGESRKARKSKTTDMLRGLQSLILW